MDREKESNTLARFQFEIVSDVMVGIMLVADVVIDVVGQRGDVDERVASSLGNLPGSP